MAVYDSATIKGRTYNRGDSFVIAKNGTWYGSSDGTNGSGSYSAGTTATFYAYSTESYSRYPYSIKSSAFNGNYPVWTTINAFPEGSYTITYNFNGGTSTGPTSQTKIYGVNLTLTNVIPTHANGSTTWSIYFNGNGGSCTKTSDSSPATLYYSFTYWLATNGNTYNAGGTYSANESTTLTAQYYPSGEATANITFPTTSQATRSGYSLIGWSTDPNATTPEHSPGESWRITESYEGTTFYAVWGPGVPRVNAKLNNSWVTGLAYVKKDNNWIPVSQVYVKQNGQWVA